ncbi:MAG: hypothetical protein ACRDAI_04415 [Candidatus Rhabdochlamydia sp.]
MPNRLISPLTRLQIISPEPLDLSLNPLEKKVLKEFKDHIPVHEISKDSQINIADIYKIINKKRIIKIKINGRYSPEIKYRIQEARKLGITIEKIAQIFNLEKHRVVYIDRCNRAILREQLAPFITFIPRSPHLRVIHKLKAHCLNRFYAN